MMRLPGLLGCAANRVPPKPVVERPHNLAVRAGSDFTQGRRPPHLRSFGDDEGAGCDAILTLFITVPAKVEEDASVAVVQPQHVLMKEVPEVMPIPKARLLLGERIVPHDPPTG